MEALYFKATKSTPQVSLDKASGLCVVEGRSIPIDAESFYLPILKWVDQLGQASPSTIEFQFKLEFFNIASSKRILSILHKLSELQKLGFRIRVKWMYEKFDEDMLEIGKDYALMLSDVFFTFHEFEKNNNGRSANKQFVNRH
ncbi:MAG: DUF1987 domain-containing protein [Flavobacteriales bacterium]|nr:DUF1987 domain-containing protein [Flavobacteriales bacterium]